MADEGIKPISGGFTIHEPTIIITPSPKPEEEESKGDLENG